MTPQDLDKTLKDGLGLRWSFMGPFETIELNAPGGIPDYCRRYGPSLSAAERRRSRHLSHGENLERILTQWAAQAATRTRSPRACAGATGGSPRSRRISVRNLPVDAAR